MNNLLEKYIDRALINVYADKNLTHGFSLDVTSLSNHEKANFLDMLMKYDPALQEKVLDRMQELIDERIFWVEPQYKYEAGLKPVINQITGESEWR